MLINFNPSLQFIYRGRRYSKRGWHTWYEPCPIIEQSKLYITVSSRTFTKGVDCGYDLYKGGEFSLNAKKLCEDGKVYHSRHGEWFYLEKPNQGDPFPSIDIMNTEDAVTMIARQLGWQGAVNTWDEWQRMCWYFATTLEIDLRTVIDRWKLGGEKEFEKLWAEVRAQEKGFFDDLFRRKNVEDS